MRVRPLFSAYVRGPIWQGRYSRVGTAGSVPQLPSIRKRKPLRDRSGFASVSHTKLDDYAFIYVQVKALDGCSNLECPRTLRELYEYGAAIHFRQEGR